MNTQLRKCFTLCYSDIQPSCRQHPPTTSPQQPWVLTRWLLQATATGRSMWHERQCCFSPDSLSWPPLNLLKPHRSNGPAVPPGGLSCEAPGSRQSQPLTAPLRDSPSRGFLIRNAVKWSHLKTPVSILPQDRWEGLFVHRWNNIMATSQLSTVLTAPLPLMTVDQRAGAVFVLDYGISLTGHGFNSGSTCL